MSRLRVLFLMIVIAAWPNFSFAATDACHPGMNVPILLYHHIQHVPGGAKSNLRRWSITPENFEAHIKWLGDVGFHPITMVQLTECLRYGKALPDRPIVLSFDDGWLDHYMVAFPILKKYHVRGTFFITTDSIGHSDFMNWQQIQEMSDAGMDIGAHSLTHPHMDRLTLPQAKHEIVESKNAIEQNLSKPVRVFAYPFGGYNAALIQMVKQAGFESAVSVGGLNHGYIQPPNTIYTLARFALTGEDTVKELAKQLYSYKQRNRRL